MLILFLNERLQKLESMNISSRVNLWFYVEGFIIRCKVVYDSVQCEYIAQCFASRYLVMIFGQAQGDNILLACSDIVVWFIGNVAS
jgi:hypothetical protein